MATRWTFFVLAGLTLVLTLALAGPAAADVTLGSTARPAGSMAEVCADDQVVAQLTDNPSTPYFVPADGKITQWQTNTSMSGAGEPVTFVVLEPAADGSFTVVGADTRTLPSPLPAGDVATFPLASPIAVAAGETLGIYTGTSGAVCYWNGGAIPAASTLVALLEPSAPAANQTLVKRPSVPVSPGGYTMNLAANFAPNPTASGPTGQRAAALKRCKKKFRHDHKKRKKCKKKAKKLPV